MTKPAFHLTRQAARTLRDIYARSEEIGGQSRAESYIAKLYAAMNKAAMDPDVGIFRQARSVPFFMITPENIVLARLSSSLRYCINGATSKRSSPKWS